ncbi:M57 family metalloprotease [Pedobacter sp. AW1-32]|uniref:M57 family metalloprotease n=1 Tax=Pedobacter sp. AW1-32 TaxID=3383026 RepID=UPI003FF0682B
MKQAKLVFFGVGCALILCIFSCRKNNTDTPPENTDIPASVLAQISNLGFSTNQVVKTSGGYLVEGDILLTNANLSETFTGANLNIAETEQYRTTNLVKSLPRVITISVTNLSSAYETAVNNAIVRYNALGLRLIFQRAASGATGNIDIQGFNEGVGSDGFITLGSAGFPTSSGNPYNKILMNTNSAAYGSNPNVLYLTSVLQHEIGHCIGLRHTDYMNRAFSCGAAGAGNEGASSYGAILIPGTPSTPDAASYMLACSNGGDRTFNANDIIALNYLYK